MMERRKQGIVMRIDVQYIVMGHGVIGLPVLDHVMMVRVLELKKEPILSQ
jgi:hypothetical protein